MRFAIFFILVGLGAYVTHWVIQRVLEPVMEVYYKPLDKAKRIALTVIGTLIFIFNIFFWIVIIAGIFVFAYLKRNGKN